MNKTAILTALAANSLAEIPKYLTNTLAAFLTGILLTASIVFLFSKNMLRNTVKWKHRQMETLSDCLSQILDRKPLTCHNTLQDTLDDKISSQLEKLQELLEYYDQMIQEEQESIKKLITEIAHQLRNPLASMESYLHLCHQDITQEEWADYLNAIQISEQKIAFLIESFIKISRLEHYSIQIKKEHLDIRETILQAMVAVGKKAENRSVELKLLTTESTLIWHDKNWLREALENLLDNSIKYSPIGSRVNIRFQNNEMFTLIQVRDYGIGIEKGEEAKIFTRFYRGRRVTTQEGFGIGLYLAREIVRHHSGFMKVARKEQGLLTEIYLPH